MPAGFRLLRYFTLSSLVVFVAVAVAMLVIERSERDLFKRVQSEQAAFSQKTLEGFARQQEEAARRSLLRVHEHGHVNLTRLFANVLWESELAPFMVAAQRLNAERCRAAPQADQGECFKALGVSLKALPGFRQLDRRVADMMQKTSVFKIKVFDLRGITIYSSDPSQVGEDKLGNRGWQLAVSGEPASELTHRDRFSTFEGVVENRDLISSYIPVRAPGGERVLGVFEIYSDVTTFLGQIRAATSEVNVLSAENQRRILRASAANQDEMDASSNQLLLIVGALLFVLYAALYLLARHAQSIIYQRELERSAAIGRELRSHREKMDALGSMAANVAHEIGNPLAAISAYAQEMAGSAPAGEVPDTRPGDIIEQTARISSMTRRIADFAAARSERLEVVDVNQMVQAVCDFMGFDRRFRGTRILFVADPGLAPRTLVPDRLTEVLMNLLQVCVEGDVLPRGEAPARIEVRTLKRGEDALIQIGCGTVADEGGGIPGWARGPRVDATRRIVEGMGGSFDLVTEPTIGAEVVLPGESPDGVISGRAA